MAILTREQLQQAIDLIRNETARDGNTRARVAQTLQNIADSAHMTADAVSLRILYIGDSHTEGSLHGATVSGAERVGHSALYSPLDEMWTTAGVAPVAQVNSGIARATGAGLHPNTDGNVGTTQMGSWVGWIPGLLRASFPTRFGRIRYCNLGLGGASSYTWSGNAATAYFGVQAVANAGDTISVNGRVYTFRAAPAVANEIKIGATVLEQAQLIASALNADGTAGAYGAGTTINTDLFVSNTPSNWLITLTARSVGAAGNANVLASSAGAGTRVYVYQQFLKGDDYANLLYNGQSDMAVSGGFGVPDIVVAFLGTNDTIRKGNLGLGYQVHMQSLISRLHSDYPLAKIVLWKPPLASVSEQQSILDATIYPAVTALVAASPSYVSSVAANTIVGGVDPTTQVISADGLHLSVLGYQYVAQLTARAICAALGLM